MEKFLEIYCDGACSGNPGPGGWGVVMIWGENIKSLYGFEENTTNNRMEITASIKALEAVKKPVKIRIYTDSIYLKKGITEWINLWKKTKWNNGKVKNIDLWQQLESLANNLDIEWYWVKGHNGNKYNEMADELARKGITENR